MKNKKLLILLCIPFVIAVMVLPLCSFTTVYTSDFSEGFEMYSSLSNVCVDYNYAYGDTGYYQGRIQNSTRFLNNYTGDISNTTSFNRAIKYTACDYYVTSSARVIIDSNESGVTQSIDGTPRINMFYKTNDNSRVQFPTSIYIENLEEADELEIGYYQGSGSSYYLMQLDNFDIKGDFDFTYCWIENNEGELSYNFRHFIVLDKHMFSQGTGTWYFEPYLWASTIVNQELVDSEGEPITTAPNFVYGFMPTFYCKLTFSVTEGDVTATTNVCDAVRVQSNFYNVASEEYNIRNKHIDRIVSSFDDSYGYQAGFDAGYSIGVSEAEGVWGSISDFLTTTIGGFLDMKIAPNITIGGVLMFVTGAGLFLTFLKIFAGG